MSTKRGVIAAVAVVAIGAALSVPFCDVLFNCGCGWPWQGLVSHCNIHNPKAAAHCPWCEYPAIAVLSFAVAAVAGAFVAHRGDRSAGLRGPAPVLKRPSRYSGAVGRSPGSPAGRAPAGPQASKRSPRMDLAIRILAGTGVFLVVAIVAGLLTKIATGYPRFLFFGS